MTAAEPPASTEAKHRSALLCRLFQLAARGDDLAGKHLLITGGSSQIGINLIAFALARGATVTALYNKTPMEFAHRALRWVSYDLNHPHDLPTTARIDILIHTATLWLLPAALPYFTAGGCRRVIAFGSTSIFGKQNSKNAYEMAVVDQLQKADNTLTAYAALHALDLTLLRPTMVYGMGMDANITRMARTIRKFGVLPLCPPAKGLRHPVRAQDLALAALAVAGNAKTYGKAYNLGGGVPITYRTMVEKLFLHLGKKPRFLALPFLPALLDAAGTRLPFLHINGEVARRMNQDLAFDMTPAIDDFNYNPQGFLEGDVIL